MPRTRGHGKRRSIFATVPAVSTRGVAISACPALRAYSDATHRILLPYLPVYRPPLPHTLVSDCTVPCRYVVHTGYAYPSALLWADLLSNKVGPSQSCLSLYLARVHGPGPGRAQVSVPASERYNTGSPSQAWWRRGEIQGPKLRWRKNSQSPRSAATDNAAARGQEL